MADKQKIGKRVKNANAEAAEAAKAAKAARAAYAAKALDGVGPVVPPTSRSNEVPPLSQPEFPDPALNLIANAAKINGAITISEFLAMHSVSGSANSLGKQLKLPH